jgi:hypothetical protein
VIKQNLKTNRKISYEVSDTARHSFFLAFGIPPEVQCEIEKDLIELGGVMPAAVRQFLC